MQTTPKIKDEVAFARGVLERLQIPYSPVLIGLVVDAINFRCKKTGNPEETEAEFVIGQAKEWRASPDGTKNPRMSWVTWFQGQHYNDDPDSWRYGNGKQDAAIPHHTRVNLTALRGFDELEAARNRETHNGGE
jgi:hypothetical protein